MGRVNDPAAEKDPLCEGVSAHNYIGTASQASPAQTNGIRITV